LEVVGGFATMPVYLADKFGTLHAGGIHGRLLTAWATAGVLGPFAMTYLRNMSVNDAINDPAAFQTKFGSSVSQLNEFVAAKTVTVSKLMELAPAGTIHSTPQPLQYNNVCNGCVIGGGVLCQLNHSSG